jgi:MFS family permease
VPAAVALAYAPGLLLVLAAASWCGAVHFGVTTPVFALVQRLAPVNGRATAAALIVLIVNLVGLGLGPLLLGWVSDLFASAGAAQSLRGSFLVAGLCSALAAFAAARASAHVRADLAQAEDRPTESTLPLHEILVQTEPG